LLFYFIFTEALDIAREQCNRAPLDTDAHAMTLSLLVASRKASKKHAVSIEEIMQRCTSVLQTNCGDSERAVQGRFLNFIENLTNFSVEILSLTFLYVL
jgi:hypothetical protein